ncbi:MAG: bifunctional 4-hydroxy-2-oxoglutarate aldolase/2-dehydro-3-deoxy-phosphogluconate aldolase [bacterium]|nr:bifunctional 4-hydroxy-2-oxoglutarate aldolase/2-dehydro-3-deoxy-phosphogluconate aldolase [bacterium]
MARFKRFEVLGAMLNGVLIPVFYHADSSTACRIAEACVDGGGRVIEFTNRGDHAIDVFRDLELHLRARRPDAILGVGSVGDAPTAALYAALGANFVVGPVLNPEVARFCNRRKIAYCPGCGSASEIAQAEELGCEIVKIFPGGQVGGPPFVKAVLGPCPWSCLMPTGGVECTPESIAGWLKAGAVCLGMGSNLITKELVDAGDFAAIAARVRETLEIIAEVKADLNG